MESARTPRPPQQIPQTAMGLSRPITQHGVEGMPLPQTASGRKRVYYDKRYYIMSVQSHMNKIREEINNLSVQTSKQKPTSASLADDRKAAKEEAKIYEKYQRQLSILNIALEMHLSRISNEQTVTETASVKQKNGGMLEELDRLFLNKTRCEETKSKLQEDLQQEDKKIQEQINKLPPEEIQQYHQLSKENQQLLKEIAKIQTEMKESQNQVLKMRENFAYNNVKQQRLKLLTELDNSGTHKKSLLGHLEAVPVEKEREILLHQVKNDKSDIEALQKVKTSLEEHLREKNNQLNGLDQELDSKNSARLKKYRDVHTRHIQVNSYIDSFEEVTSGIRSNLKEKESVILGALDVLLEKTSEDNFEEVDDLQSELTSSNSSDQYKLLHSRLSRLTDIKQKCEEEFKNLKEKQEAMLKEMITFKNIDGKIEELKEQNKDTEEKQKSLKNLLKVTASAVEDAKKRLTDFERTLDKNYIYHEFVQIGRQLEQLETINEKLGEDIKIAKSNNEFDKIMTEVAELAKAKNDSIIDTLKKKNNQ